MEQEEELLSRATRSKFHYIGSPLSARMIFILLQYLLSFVTVCCVLTVTSSAHQISLWFVTSFSAAISVPLSVPGWW